MVTCLTFIWTTTICINRLENLASLLSKAPLDMCVVSTLDQRIIIGLTRNLATLVVVTQPTLRSNQLLPLFICPLMVGMWTNHVHHNSCKRIQNGFKSYRFASFGCLLFTKEHMKFLQKYPHITLSTLGNSRLALDICASQLHMISCYSLRMPLSR